MEFKPFGKIPRLRRGMVITEKVDGTNAQVCISKGYADEPDVIAHLYVGGTDYNVRAGSRTRWITPENDNFGFAHWVQLNAEQLFTLGEGHHFGEWWGRGINRGYDQTDKYFSLFNTGRWINFEEERTSEKQSVVPSCASVVPVLYRGPFITDLVEEVLEALQRTGSRIAPGYMNPEGIIIFHEASGHLFKYTLGSDGHKEQR